MKKKISFYSLFIFLLIFSSKIYAENIWVVNKELSSIEFHLPVFLAEDVKGKFNIFDGNVVIDEKKTGNKNRAFFYVGINSLEINYQKYKDLLLSEIFFNEKIYPLALIDTKKFNTLNLSYIKNINAELQIKDIIKLIPVEINIKELANNFIQISAIIKFSRNSYELGKGSWSSTFLLKDEITLKANIFLEK